MTLTTTMSMIQHKVSIWMKMSDSGLRDMGEAFQVINHEANNLDITFNNTFGYNRYQDNWSNNENIINFDSRIGKEISKYQHFEIITGFNYITQCKSALWRPQTISIQIGGTLPPQDR